MTLLLKSSLKKLSHGCGKAVMQSGILNFLLNILREATNKFMFRIFWKNRVCTKGLVLLNLAKVAVERAQRK